MAYEMNTDGMLDVYLFENRQLLDKLQEKVLEQKDAEGFDEDSINEIFRTMHTIKGSSGIMMFDEITEAAHKLEDIFFYIRESHPDNIPHVELVEYVLEVADFINTEMDKLSAGGQADGSSKEIVEHLDRFLKSVSGNEKPEAFQEDEESPQRFYIAPMATEASRFYRIYITYTPETPMVNIHAYKIVFAMREIAEDLLYYPEDIVSDEHSADEILQDGFKILLQAQCDEDRLREIVSPGYEIAGVEIEQITPTLFQRGIEAFGMKGAPEIDLDSSVEEIRERCKDETEEISEPDAKKEIAPGDYVIESKKPGKAKTFVKDNKSTAQPKTAYISVDVKKMDMLMDLIGELVISESVVLQNQDLKVPGLRLDNFNKAAGQMLKISTELQDVIMSMRMVPLTNTFQKMNRIVFDCSRKLGKDVEFKMVGDTTEVDKNIIEHISDPLMHLVRNAVDHGIEEDAERKAAGKTEKGTVTLSAKTESGKVWISVSDNGGGLNRKKILEKARLQGLVDADRNDSSYSDREVYQLITLPGFSTNEKVTEYSGRGVGMDVVVANITSIGGTLEIDSTPGQGSIMTMKIPLTLAIIDGIVMRVGKNTFVIETRTVKEFVNVKQEAVIQKPNGEEVVMLRGEGYPLLRLDEWYGIEGAAKNISEGMIVMVESEKGRFCLFVDELIGKQEIVVKPIPDYIKRVHGLSGCTQLGDGRIALILDVTGMLET